MTQTDPGPSAADVLEELRNLPEKDRIEVVLSDERYTGRQLVELLIQLSHSLRYENPKQMLHWAGLARIVADRTPAGAGGSKADLADLKVEAWGYWGNSLRVCGHVREAEEALSISQAFLSEGSGDPIVKARLLEQTASLSIFQRKLDMATQLTREASQIYQTLGERKGLARTLVIEATARLYDGHPDSAVDLLNHALSLIDGKEDPRLLLAACHNLVRCYTDLAMPEQALTIYRETRELYTESDDPLILLRLGWQEGQLLRELGSLKGAETMLIAARDGFRHRGLAYESAVISLDLAAVYRAMGLTDQARKAAADALPTFRALHVDRETLASLILAIRPLSP